MATQAPAQIDRERIRELTDREERRLNERTPKSRAMYERARTTLVGGVASSYQLRDPWPIYLERGDGARVWDIDGNEMLDFHNGFGSTTQGHAHPAISRAVERRVRAGTQFAAPTEDAVTVAEELQRRWELPKWRYTNSGTEATMDAIRVARALTGRDTIVKIFGSYHGHHDAVMVSTGSVDVAGIAPDELPSVGYGAGLPEAIVEMTVAVPFNDVDAMERRIERLEEVLTPAAYEHLDRLNDRILAGCSRVIDDHALPGYAIGIVAKGCVTFSAERIVDYASFKANQDEELTDLAWLYSMNRGIFMTPGREEEWTLTVAHDDAAIDRYVAVFAELGDELTA